MLSRADLGEADEHFLRAYYDSTSVAFRGWKLADKASLLGVSGTHSRTALWLTVGGDVVAAHRTSEGDDSETAMYEGEWTFVDRLDALHDVPNWIHNVTGYGPSGDDTEVAFEVLERARARLEGRDVE